MWARRPFGQIAKCSESQALRKAFPEFGSQPTADEMEGHELFNEKEINPAQTEVQMPKSKSKPEPAPEKPAVIDGETGEILNPPPERPAPKEPPREAPKPAAQTTAAPGSNAGMIGVVNKQIRNKQEEFNAVGTDFNVLKDVLTNFGITSIDEVSQENVNDIMKHIRGLSAQ
jgi:hypothetical protein